VVADMRADQLLVHRGLAASRSQAARLIEGGARWLSREGWRAVSKSDELPEDAEIDLADAAEARYVSRGGLKLEDALSACGVDVSDKWCLDVGQSTGGFTDCLLQRGAAHVVGVDVGHGQLHARLRADARVSCAEKVNARALTWDALDALNAPNLIAGDAHSIWADGPKSFKNLRNSGFDLIVGDVSFISQTLLLAALTAMLAKGGEILMLVKPQFELQPELLGKGGLVKDESLYTQVEARIRDAYAAHGLQVLHYIDSPITGGDGNREFFVHARSS
jgi:23S rRNA (cytidine1920-2'-O)/16S rRNA (cytidine1409-2'-O)-methyltransferase